jgi:hypothetical protein
MDGTSMAAPYISGLAALYLEKYNKDKQKIKQFQYHLLNTAQPMFDSSKGTGELMTVIRQGAGVVRPYRLLEVEDYVSPRKLELGKINDPKQVQEKQITIHNQGKTAKTYILKHTPAVAIRFQDESSPIKEPRTHANVRFHKAEVTVPPMKSAQVRLSIDSGALFQKENLFYSGYVEVLDKATKEILRVPYMGFSGDKRQLQILQQPKLLHVQDQDNAETYTDATTSTALKPAFETTLTEMDCVLFDYKLQIPASLLVITIVKASEPQTDIQVIKEMQLAFNTPPSEEDVLSDDIPSDNAVMILKSVSEIEPNENYIIKVSAHTLHREPHEWLSPVFRVLP